MKIKVLVYPNDSNPYQGLLYSHMRNIVEITYLKGLTLSQTINNILLPFQLIFYRVRGYRVFHIHWVYLFTFPGKGYLSILFSTIYYYFILIFIKINGYKIVWTVHNVLPHEKTFINDISARRFLSRFSSLIIIHSSSTIEQMKKYSFNVNKCRTIPIGNFIGVYPNLVSKIEARKKLQIDKNDFVFLFLGKIEPYKGVENLAKVFTSLSLPSAKLIIAGKCSDVNLSKNISKYTFSQNIVFINQFISDKDIQIYLNASDIAVYPFERVTTSSSVLLPLSFKKAIVYPRIGNLKEVPDNIGYSYLPNDPDGLRRCLLTAIRNRDRLERFNSNAYRYAQTLSWDTIAENTFKAYTDLVTKA